MCPPLNNLPPCAANLSTSARLARGMCADSVTAAPPQPTAAYEVAAAKQSVLHNTVQSSPPAARGGAKIKSARGGDCTRGGTRSCVPPLCRAFLLPLLFPRGKRNGASPSFARAKEMRHSCITPCAPPSPCRRGCESADGAPSVPRHRRSC